MNCKICLKSFDDKNCFYSYDSDWNFILICDDCVKKELKKN